MFSWFRRRFRRKSAPTEPETSVEARALVLILTPELEDRIEKLRRAVDAPNMTCVVLTALFVYGHLVASDKAGHETLTFTDDENEPGRPVFLRPETWIV